MTDRSDGIKLVSTFRNSTDPTVVCDLDYKQVLEKIRSGGKTKQQVLHVRDIYQKEGKSERYSKEKKKLPGITFSGNFGYRDKLNLLTATGFIVADLDSLEDVDSAFNKLSEDKHTWFVFRSPSNDGLKCAFRDKNIKTVRDLERFYYAIEAYFKQIYNLKTDPACKDISRLCFFSYDPDIYINEDPLFFDVSDWTIEEPDLESERPEPTKEDLKHSPAKEKYAREVLKSCCNAIRESELGNQHYTRLNRSRLMGGYLNYVSEKEALTEIEKAVKDSGAENMQAAMKTVGEGLNHGKQTPLVIPGLSIQDEQDKKSTETSFLPPPPNFPLYLLPKYFQEVIQQAANAFVVPIEVPAATLLSLVGTCVGRSRGLVVKSGWIEHPNLYIALTARSGLGKSPCMKAFLNGIFRIEKQMFDKYQKELQIYQTEMEERKRQKKSELGPPPEKPTWTQIYVEDTTEEALTAALSGNSKGILWYNDELSGLLLNLGRYRTDGKDGGAKARLMSAYDSGPWKRTRKSGDNAYILAACLSILGTLQPAILPDLFSDLDAAIGFMPRFIFIRAEPREPAVWTDETFDEQIKQRIDLLIESLLDYEIGENDKPKLIGMSKEAKVIYQEWFNEQSLEPWRDFEAQQYEALSSKLRGQCARLALILHILESHAGNKSELEPIQEDTMQRAIELANWVKIHQRQVWKSLGNAGKITECSPLEKRVAQAIINLESEIQSRQILTSKVTEKVNEDTDEKFQVNSRSVGKAVSKLGLTVRKGSGGKRFISISEDQLNILKENAINATNATNPDPTGIKKGGVYIQNATNATNPKAENKKESGVSGMSDKNATAIKHHEQGVSGDCGESGVYQRAKI